MPTSSVSPQRIAEIVADYHRQPSAAAIGAFLRRCPEVQREAALVRAGSRAGAPILKALLAPPPLEFMKVALQTPLSKG